MKMSAQQILLWRLTAAFLVSLLLLVHGCGQVPGTPPSRHEEVGSTPSADSRSSGRYDLRRDESRGGHTLSRHVGRTDEELARRLRKERNIAAASTWTNQEIAEETVAAALRAERGRIDSWMRRGEPRPNLALHFNAGRPIGRSLRRGEDSSAACTNAVIVLRADDPDGFYVLTTYPEARE